MSVVKKLRIETRERLQAAGVRHAIMGLDVSFNESRANDYEPHWSLHFRIHVPTALSWRSKASLRKQYPPTPTIRRPMVIASFDGRARGMAYTVKPNFKRRQSYRASVGRGGRMNTRERPMRGDNHTVLALFLDRIGFSGRLCLLWVDLLRVSRGIRFVARAANRLRPG